MKSPILRKRNKQDESFLRLNHMLRRCGMEPQKIPILVGHKYRIQSLLGYGSFGCIFSSVHIETGVEYAVKFEHVKARFPQLLFEKRIYDTFHVGTASYVRRKRQVCSTSTQPHKNKNKKSTVSDVKGGKSNGSFGSNSSQNSSLDTWISGIFDYCDVGRFFQNGILIGIPRVHFFGSVQNYNIMVMDKLGPNLEDLFSFCSRKFSLKTVLMIGDQLISRLCMIHSRHFIHRDIKPENFLMGVGNQGCCVYVVDFGLAKKYYNAKLRRHIKMRKGKPLTGTVRYTSLNSHLGIEQSRRDDLESLGFMLVYFMRGNLPWQGLKAETKDQRYEKIFLMKMSTSMETLCKSLPNEFLKYSQYVRKLNFHEKPDYDYLRSLFMNLFKKMKYKQNLLFDWILLRKKIFTQDNIQKYVEE